MNAIYNFEISGKMKLEEPEDKQEEINTRKTFLGKVLKYKFEMIWWIIFTIDFIFSLALPEGDFREMLYLFHEKSTLAAILFFSFCEVIYLFKLYIRNKRRDIINHIIIGLLTFGFLLLNLWIYEKVLGPKLTTIEILSPQNREEVSGPAIEVRAFVRNIETPIYLIVETPQGSQWVQSKRYTQTNKFKDILTEVVRLGEGYIGIGEEFKIFAIGAKEDLEIGILEKIPPHSIVSNTVAVKKVK